MASEVRRVAKEETDDDSLRLGVVRDSMRSNPLLFRVSPTAYGTHTQTETEREREREGDEMR
jgi:hypothetical protein